MTKMSVAPWSQLDDELDERQDAAGAAHYALSPDGVSEPSSWATESGLASIGRPVLNVSPYWALVPLAGSIVWLIYGAVCGWRGQNGLSFTAVLGVLGLAIAAGVVLLISRAVRQAGIRSIYQAIRQNSVQTQHVLENLPIAAELRPVWEAVREHAANIERRVAELLGEHRQMSLELSLTDTQKRQIESILHSVPEPLLVVDAFDQVLLVNNAAATLFGREPKEMVRRPLAEVVGDQKLVGAIRQAREADSRAAHRRTEHEIGSRIFLAATAPLAVKAAAPGTPAESGGESHGLVVMFRDITKEREAAKMKSEFVARAAHELRTPLSSIRAYVEMLVDGEAADDKTRAEYLSIIQGSADRLGRMIDNILNISRIEAGTIRINKEPVAVAVVVKEVIDVARPQAEQKKLTLTEELTPVVFRVMADRDLLYQAILNLLSNAIKYTPEGGEVHVRMTPCEAQRTIGIEVSDNGVGIPKEDLPKMFEKFFRVEATKKMAKGTGLGLNLVKHIVETIHEGRMTLVSEVGKGSTFGMTLPLCA